MLSHGLEFLLKGGWVMWPLFACAVLSVAVMIERLIVIRRAAGDSEERLMRPLRRLLDKRQYREALVLCESTPGPVAALCANGIRERGKAPAVIERAMEEHALREISALNRRLGILDTIITLSPLLGLLGTITGMIRSFQVVALAAGTATAGSAITGGVAEALIATATGLSIAIITLPVYNYLHERVQEIISDMEACGTQLVNLLAAAKQAEEHQHEVAATRA